MTASKTASISLLIGLIACNRPDRMQNPSGEPPDLSNPFVFDDDGGIVYPGTDGGGGGGNGDPCGDVTSDPACQSIGAGPPIEFPLQSDPNPNPLEKDNGVNRDNNGYLGLDSTLLLVHPKTIRF